MLLFTRTRAVDISITSLILPWHCKDVKSKRSKCDNFTLFLLTEDGTESFVPHVQHACFFPIRPIKFLIYIDVVTVAVIDANGSATKTLEVRNLQYGFPGRMEISSVTNDN